MPGEQTIRLVFFFGVLAVVAAWEIIAPRRPLTDSKGRRWFTNLTLVAVNSVLVRFTVPVLPVGMAIIVHERGWGILNVISLPQWVTIALAIIFLDFVIYIQHVLFHFLPVLWRLHRMHHTDLDIDVTTGNRFHPVEMVISMGIKLAAVAFIGAPAMAVVMFEVVLNATSQFNHGNIRIPGEMDRWLRLIVVIPFLNQV